MIQGSVAQATIYLATALKSNPIGFCVLGGGQRRRGAWITGSATPSPARPKSPFEEADIAQQYMPDELTDRHYYLPTGQGYEATIANRMEARADKRAAGKPRRSTKPKPEIARGAGDGLLRTREANRKKLAETEMRDAADDVDRSRRVQDCPSHARQG